MFEELEALFRGYGENGSGRTRRYLHNDEEAASFGQQPGTFTPWENLPAETDLLFYEGLHGAAVTETIDIARNVDLLIGVVPVINLEWTQKLHRDRTARRHTTEAVTDTILRRMHDYVHYICPQFSRTHINFQRVPTVDTSNPFIARFIPTPDESFLVIRFANPRGIDFPYLLSMMQDSFMSRANTIVVPGGKMDLAMHGSSSVPQEWLDVIRSHGGEIRETYGVPVEEIQRGIKHGVRKINIDTDIRLAMTGAMRRRMASDRTEFDPRKFLGDALDAARQICKARFTAFGSAGKAPAIRPLSLDRLVEQYSTGRLRATVN